MKRTIAIALAVIAAVLLTLSGCSDFSFNPIGRWEVSEMRLYEDGSIKETKDTKQLGMSSGVALVFKKSGTGYIDSGSGNPLDFTYNYNDSEVIISRSVNDSPPIETKYRVIDDGTSLSVTLSSYDDINAKGKKCSYSEEMIFKR